MSLPSLPAVHLQVALKIYPPSISVKTRQHKKIKCEDMLKEEIP